MTLLRQVNGRTIIDYMARDYDSLLNSMRELIPYLLPEWTDYESEADFGNVMLQLFAHMGDILSYYQDRVANESFLTTAQNRHSIIDHLRLIGYRLGTAAAAATTLTLTLPGDCEEVITIQRGHAFATTSTKDKSSVRFEYARESELLIDCSALKTAADGKKYYEGVPVEQGRLIADEILGTSDGTPDQRFSLAHAPIILKGIGEQQLGNRDVILVTQIGDTIEEWNLQETLAFSQDGQKDFIIEIDADDEAAVIFGDGDFGGIPYRGAEIRVTYRVGGGSEGNVAANTIQTIVDVAQLTLLGAKVTNPQPAQGGVERESIEHGVEQAPTVFRTMRRAVTADDYKTLALAYRGVAKVRAEAATDRFNTVYLYVAPDDGGHVSDVLKANLLTYFEDKRPILTAIEIKDVDYVKIYISAEIGVRTHYLPDHVKWEVETAVADLLNFDNVDFAQTLYLSRVYQAIEAIEGIEYVSVNEFCRDAPTGEMASSGKIVLLENEIPIIPDDVNTDTNYLAGIWVTIEGET